MYKKFPTQGRNDKRGAFRPSSPRRNEEQPGNTQRPRLNRASVDRAWEQGAAFSHPDYKPRQQSEQRENFSRQPRGPRSQSSERPRSSFGSQNRGPRSFQRDEQEENFQPRRQFGARPGAPRSSFGTQNRGPRSFQRDEQQGEGFQPRSRSFERPRPSYGAENRGPRSFQRDEQEGNFQPRSRSFERPRSSYGAENRGPRSFQRDEQEEGFQPRRQFGARPSAPRQGSRPPFREQRSRSFEGSERSPFQQRESRPRRPFGQRPSFQEEGFRERQPLRFNDYRETRQEPSSQQYEGDYESFDMEQVDERPARPQRAPRAGRAPAPRGERRPSSRPRTLHTTTLEDGRVLKGPLPQQRQQEQYWTEIAEEKQELLAETEARTPVQPKKERKAKPAKQAALSKKGEAKVKKRGVYPKPSQKGYKWPSPQAE